MGLRFVVEEGVPDACDDLPWLVRERADRAALGAGLFAAEVLVRLPLRGNFEDAGQQRLHGRQGDLFHLGEMDVGSGPPIAPVLTDDDFAPAPSEFLNTAKILGCELACGHDVSPQGLPRLRPDEIVSKSSLRGATSCKVGPAPRPGPAGSLV
jgi:hypothetical protein